MRYVKLKEKKTLLIGISGSVSASGLKLFMILTKSIPDSLNKYSMAF